MAVLVSAVLVGATFRLTLPLEGVGWPDVVPSTSPVAPVTPAPPASPSPVASADPIASTDAAPPPPPAPPAPAPAPRSAGCTGGSLVVVAHTDDDLLFLNPTLQRDIRSKTCVNTVYVTAGDAGLRANYWQNRERGAQAAYALMAAVPDEWEQGTVTSRGVIMRTLRANPHVHLVFMRLPDGMPRGAGTKSTNYQSLKRLWTGDLDSVTAVDGGATYSKDELVQTLADLMAATRPATVRTLDYVGTYQDTDHSDHHTVGYLTRAASARYRAPHTLVSYQGYPVASRKANVPKSDAKAKLEVFNTYALHDAAPQNRNYITREYVVARQR